MLDKKLNILSSYMMSDPNLLVLLNGLFKKLQGTFFWNFGGEGTSLELKGC